MFGAAAMSLSSFFVVTNALRLNLLKIHDGSKDKPIKNQVTSELINNIKNSDERMKEEMTTKTIMIEGMMCEHCERAVKKALEAIEGVENAEVSHEKGCAVVNLKSDVADEVMKKAVEEEDYKVTSIN